MTPPSVPRWAELGPLRTRRAVRLPRWLPLPVVAFAPVAAAEPIATIAVFPLIGLLAAVVAAAVSGAAWWAAAGSTLGRRDAAAGALWGAAVAVPVVVAVASLFGWVAEVTYVSYLGPAIEEAVKVTFVLWALWRARTVVTAFDGVIAAWWCAIGFAFVENVSYFYNAALSGNLATVAVTRGILSPFAHLLFATFAGYAVGYAAQRCWGPVRTTAAAAVGVVVATLGHSAWNTAAYTAGEVEGWSAAGLIAHVVGFIVLFCGVAVAAAFARDAERARLEDAADRSGAAAGGDGSVDGDAARVGVLASAVIAERDERRRHERLSSAVAMVVGSDRVPRARRRNAKAAQAAASAAAPTSAVSGSV